MGGKRAGSYPPHCTITLESGWKEKSFLAPCSRRNLSSESLHNKDEVTHPTSPTGILQKDTNVFRWAILGFDCSSDRRDFFRE